MHAGHLVIAAFIVVVLAMIIGSWMAWIPKKPKDEDEDIDK